MRVVLPAEGVHARVFDGDAWHDDLPLVTVPLAEDEDAAMAEQTDDAVLLKERSGTAFVRLGGSWHAGVPIFKARPRPGGGEDEVRVTVAEIRAHRRTRP